MIAAKKDHLQAAPMFAAPAMLRSGVLGNQRRGKVRLADSPVFLQSR